MFRRKQDEETSYWLSYSDMMAGLLLCFVLIISLTMLRAKVQYDEKETQLAGKEDELNAQSVELVNQQKKLSLQSDELEAQKNKLIAQEEKLMSQEETLNEQDQLLGELQALLDEQEAKLQDIIGVRKELIEKLKDEFENSDLSITVDETTGDITFDSSILFDYNKSTLIDSGQELLSSFLPRYIDILLSDEYKDYISEVDIVGHTDTDGTYLFNLDLSQARAYNVAQYFMSEDNDILSDSEREKLQEVLTTSGKSYSSPVYNDDGSVNMEASRRVEISFRLKDEEMVKEMIEVLSTSKEEAEQAAESADTDNSENTEEVVETEE